MHYGIQSYTEGTVHYSYTYDNSILLLQNNFTKAIILLLKTDAQPKMFIDSQSFQSLNI